MNATNYLENKILGLIFQGSTYSISSLKIGLFSADPGEAGDVSSEVSTTDTNYSRVTIANNSTNFDLINDDTENDGGKYIVSKNEINFNLPSASWGTVTHAGIFDDSNNMIFYKALNTSFDIQVNASVKLPIGSIKVRLR